MKIFVLIVIVGCAFAADVKEKEDSADTAQNKDKRQTQGEVSPDHFIYRAPRKQEQVAPVEEEQDDDKIVTASNRAGGEQYRPGQVFSLNAQELLELQPQRKAPLASSQQLQQLYSNLQPEHKQGLQQFYYIDPQVARQVTLQPSRTVIARPPSSANVGEASVGAALSVSETGASSSDSTFDEELLALLGHSPGRQEDSRTQTYSQAPQVSTQSVAPQYQQIERYITKPTKKPTKLQPKGQLAQAQSAVAPQQYLIETTNVAQQQPKQQQQQQLQQQQQQQQQYRIVQQQRPAPTLRYVPIQQVQSIPQVYYNPESQNQGLKIVAAPKLQQPRAQLAYRIIPQYQQEASPKQYRLYEARPQVVRTEQARVPASSVDRPVTYINRYPESEKNLRAVKIFDQAPELLSNYQKQPQVLSDQYYLRSLYRPTEQRVRYEIPQYALAMESFVEPTKPPHSAIYVNKNIAPKKATPQPQLLKIDEPLEVTPQPLRVEQPSRAHNIKIEKHGQSIEERRAQLPPPRNNKAYTPEEFQALVDAGYSVTPVPVSSYEAQSAQSRSSIETAPAAPPRRIPHNRRHQYLPLRSDEAP